MIDEEENNRAGSRMRQLFNTGVEKPVQESTPENSEDDEFDIPLPDDKPTVFSAFQPSLYVPPDELAEEDPTRYSIRSWTSVLLAQRHLPFVDREVLFKRALKLLPYSYKLWVWYLGEFCDFVLERPPQSRKYSELNSTFEACLRQLPKMPRVWLMYCEMLARQHLVKQTRRTYNWALRNLPLTQHKKIWESALKWARSLSQPSTEEQMTLRYLQLEPDGKDEAISSLRSRGGQPALLVKLLLSAINDAGFVSKQGRSRLDYAQQLVEIIAKDRKGQLELTYCEQVLRGFIVQFAEEAARFWVALAECFMRHGEFERAREVFEDALAKVKTARQFGVVFNAYTKFEEEMIAALSDEAVLAELGLSHLQLLKEVETRLARLEDLVQKRPFIAAELRIKSNPHSPREWTALFDLEFRRGGLKAALAVIERALQQIDPQKSEPGTLGRMVVHFAESMREQSTVKERVQVFAKAGRLKLRHTADAQTVVLGLVELLLSEGYTSDASKTLRRFIFARKLDTDDDPNLRYLKQSNKLWSLYLDIQVYNGTFQTARAAYEKCKESRSLTPVMALNYCEMLWEGQQQQQAFAVYEWCVANMAWPATRDIWFVYLHKYMQLTPQTGLTLERGRSIFEKALGQCPSDQLRPFLFLYAGYEERHGLYSRCFALFDRLLESCPQSERLQNYYLYMAKVTQLIGITKCRPIYEKALTLLREREIVRLGQFCARLECKLGETERARKIYEYSCQFSSPSEDIDGVWAEWQEFEARHGSKDYYRDLIRVRRAVEDKFRRAGPDPEVIKEQVAKGLL